MRIDAHAFLSALTYFTRIRSPIAIDQARAEGSACLAPVVGWIVGAVAAVVFLAAELVFPVTVSIVLSMVASILVTGALHEDGFMDFCDGFGGGATREQTLRIMRDSTVGAFAVLGAVMILLLKLAALVALATALAAEGRPVGAILAATLVAAHGASRFVAVAFMYTGDYVPGDSPTKAAAMAKRMRGEELLIAAAGGVLPVVVLGAVSEGIVVFALVPLLFVFIAMDHLLKRRIGGYTGDCLGAAQQISEVVFYLGVLALVAA